MQERLVYLDTSAIVKRYVKEKGTDIVDEIFKSAELKDVTIYLSLWNIGEAVTVFDRYSRKKLVKLNVVLDNFLNELSRLSSIGSLETINITSTLMGDSIEYILKYHIYVADALQIASCKYAKCDEFLTSDRKLADAVNAEKVKGIFLE